MDFPEYQVFEVGEPDLIRQALAVFQFQYSHNPVYQLYTDSLRIDPRSVRTLTQIPFLPIGFFKTHRVVATDLEPEAVFESSGTTHTGNSRHYVKSLALYRKSFTRGFERSYGPVGDWCIIGLLPSYLERSNSSLVRMADELITMSGHPDSGFYLYDHEKLFETLNRLEAAGQKTLLIGVSFALLDLAEKYKMELKHTVVMETGGMKGRRKEMIRAELHEVLKERLGLPVIHAEYGMTELLSQAWSAGGGLFRPVPWMKALIRSEDDPFDLREEGAGILNIIDLANIYSCSFLATEDVGTVRTDGNFEVSGRVDNSDIRGCSLLVV
jgi:phenylacetate-coenzyme A ligase PaaK-like adenylate-forming protein